MSTYPKVVVFDLDYTLWPCWCDTHISPPLKAKSQDTVVDKYGYTLSFYKDVPEIIERLRAENVVVVAASRTHAPQVAKKLLKLLHINGKPAFDYFDHMEWGTFSKKNHIKSALSELRSTGRIDDSVELEHVVLFDDEMRNKDVETIGCLMVHIPSEEHGLTNAIFERGLKKYHEKLQGN